MRTTQTMSHSDHGRHRQVVCMAMLHSQAPGRRQARLPDAGSRHRDRACAKTMEPQRAPPFVSRSVLDLIEIPYEGSSVTLRGWAYHRAASDPSLPHRMRSHATASSRGMQGVNGHPPRPSCTELDELMARDQTLMGRAQPSTPRQCSPSAAVPSRRPPTRHTTPTPL